MAECLNGGGKIALEYDGEDFSKQLFLSGANIRHPSDKDHQYCYY